MDIAEMSMALKQSQVQQQASLSVMKKVMDQAEGNGEFIEKMLADSSGQVLQNKAQPHLGGNIDRKG
jgi:hypothetical protein